MTDGDPVASIFDTPDRTHPDVLARTVGVVASAPLVTELLEAYPTAAVILDENWQIVAFNRKCLPYVRGGDESELYGRRLGDAIRCLHARQTTAGCGTTIFCGDCGATAAVRTTREAGVPTVRECRIIAHDGGREVAYDLRVHTAPIVVDGRRLIVAAIEDIAHEKRREALERIFFHDVVNTADTIAGVARLLPHAREPQRAERLLRTLARCSTQLVEEIHAQRDLLDAERGDLLVTLKPVPARAIAAAVADMCAAWTHDGQQRVVTDPWPADVMVDTDMVQAVRCLANLARNALEASRDTGEIRLGGDLRDSRVLFRVTNAGVLPDHVQRQIFQRSFSTKAPRGRGIGTYSVKLIVEQYLGGAVSFVSDAEHQTVFTIELPRGT